MRPLALVQGTLVGEEQAERARGREPAHAQAARVEGAARAAERVVHLRQLVAQPRLALDRECEPRLVDARQDLRDDEIGTPRRPPARRSPRTRPRARVRGDPRPRAPRSRRARERRRRVRPRGRRDTSPASAAVLNVWESSPRWRARALAILGLAPGSQEDRRSGRTRSPRPPRAGRGRARARARPPRRHRARGRSMAIVQPGSCAVEKATRWPGLPSRPRTLESSPTCRRSSSPLQRAVARPREPREHRTAAAVQHGEAVEAEVEGSAADLEAVREQGPGEHAGEAAARVASGHGHARSRAGACASRPGPR